LTAALEDATQGAHGVDPEAPEPAVARGEAKAAAPAAHAEAGEGIGLSIVKRLCELLDATIEIESDASTGTTFRILIPRQYAASVN
jgi:two-component sensor histidine kinase